ncbi:MAG: S8 family serine peptidase [Candidatus Zixiibacteriota bacterium]
MRVERFICYLSVVIVVLAAGIRAQFYHGTDGMVPLGIDSTKVVVKFDAGASPQDVSSRIARIVVIVQDTNMLPGFVACSLSVTDGYMAFVDSLNNAEGIYLGEPYYYFPSGLPATVGETFVAAFNLELSAFQIDSINLRYRVVIDHALEGIENVFILRNTDSSGYRLLDITNLYYDLPETRYADPQFGIRVQAMSYKLFDYYHLYQPHTKKVIGTFNSTSVWDFAGLNNPDTVAVIDDGVDTHEDLPASRILAGRDYFPPDWDPRPGSQQNHGQSVAGTVGASHTTDSVSGLQTSSGIFSLNPGVKILPVKIFSDLGQGMLPEEIAPAIIWAYENGADILSNSWGLPPGYMDDQTLNEALQEANTMGRFGRGCPVIFSSGNWGGKFAGVAYPARLPYCFAVGATHLDDTRWEYSSYGADLDLMAPSGDTDYRGDVWSLDRMGSLGKNPNEYGDCPPVANDFDYNCHFGGTSAACPVVSGTASLLLSRDSMLTADVVYEILRYSAVPIGATVPNDTFGYGRVDAFRAVLSIAHGDATNDGAIDISDLTAVYEFLCCSGPDFFPSHLLGDCDCDGFVDISDVVWLVDMLFENGPAPVKPCYEF